MHNRVSPYPLIRFTSVGLLLLSACLGQPAGANPNNSLPSSAATATRPSPTSTLPPPTTTPTAIPTLTPSLTPLPPSATPTSAFRLCSPLAMHPLAELPEIIGDPYNPPPPGREERHHGVDFAYYHWGERDSMLGEPVQAVLSGFVASALNDRFPYGNMVMIETPRSLLPANLVALLEIPAGESLYILFAHLNQAPLVSLGETVVACQPLGEVGMSGNTDIPHLHVETRLGPAGAVFESMLFYNTRATQPEMDNYKLWRTSGVFRHFDPLILLSALVP